MRDNILKIAIIISLTAHSLVIFGTADILQKKEDLSMRDIEIAYIQIKNMQAEILQAKKKIAQIKAGKAKNPVEKTAKKNESKTAITAFKDKILEVKKEVFERFYSSSDGYNLGSISEKYTPQNKYSQDKKLFDKYLKSSADPVLKKTALVKSYDVNTSVMFAKRLSKSESYMDYYHMLRSRIKTFASYNYPGTEKEGEVAVSFILSKNGSLKSMNIIDDKSAKDYRLRIAAVKSIKKAAPFPPFPKTVKDLDISELTFNIVISFKLKD